jgi:CBS domain-containing protein
MRSADAVLTAKTNEALEDLIPRLNKVSGLPVVDATGKVVGVISRKVRRVALLLGARACVQLRCDALPSTPSARRTQPTAHVALNPKVMLLTVSHLEHTHTHTHTHARACMRAQDIIRVRRADGSLRDRVSEHMTSPPVTVGPSVSVRQAATIMLQNRIRRLPVVDSKGQAMG